MDHPEEDLSAYLSNELNESERANIERHLAECLLCSKKLSELRKLQEIANEADEIEPREDFLSRVMARVEEEKRVIQFRTRRNVAIFVAAAIIAFFVFILTLQNRSPSPVVQQPKETAPPTPIAKQEEQPDDTELIAHLDDLENMDVIQHLEDLDQFDVAMMLAENEVTTK